MATLIVFLFIGGLFVLGAMKFSEMLTGKGSRKSPDSFEKDGAIQLLDSWMESVYGSPHIKGRMRNNTNSIVGFISVRVKFYNSRGECVQDGIDNHVNFMPDEVWVFDVPVIENTTRHEISYEIVGTAPQL